MLILVSSGNGIFSYIYMLIHASTKVFIFLLFGFIINLNGNVRDLRKMGGFFRFSSLNYISLINICFLSSLPFFPLAFLKDSIIIFLSKGFFITDISIALLMLSALFNYLYMFRLFFKIFFGDILSFFFTFFYNNILIGNYSFYI